MQFLWDNLEKISLLLAIPLAIIAVVAINWQWQDRTRFAGNLDVNSSQIKIIFGSNTSLGTPNILVVDNKPIFSAEIKNNKLFIYLTVFDKDGKIVAQVNGNEWTVNQNNFFTIDKSNNKVKITNQYGEVALDASVVSGDTIKVNGTFYVGGNKIVATDNGLIFNP